MLGRLAKDMAIYGAGDMVFKFLAFAIFPIYAHLFRVDQFGIMELVNTLAGLISIFLSLGITSAVQRFYWDPDFQRPGDRPWSVRASTCWGSGPCSLRCLSF